TLNFSSGCRQIGKLVEDGGIDMDSTVILTPAGADDFAGNTIRIDTAFDAAFLIHFSPLPVSHLFCTQMTMTTGWTLHIAKSRLITSRDIVTHLPFVVIHHGTEEVSNMLIQGTGLTLIGQLTEAVNHTVSVFVTGNI